MADGRISGTWERVDNAKSILRSKFATAYMFGKDTNKVVVMNTTKEPLLIKKGTRVAELHPRALECTM